VCASRRGVSLDEGPKEGRFIDVRRLDSAQADSATCRRVALLMLASPIATPPRSFMTPAHRATGPALLHSSKPDSSLFDRRESPGLAERRVPSFEVMHADSNALAPNVKIVTQALQ